MSKNNGQLKSQELREAVEARSDALGVSQNIMKQTKSSALAYAMKHKLSMAETFERAVSLLIEYDTTPDEQSSNISNTPDDANGLSEVTLKFTGNEMKALRKRIGILSPDVTIEAFLKTKTDLFDTVDG